MGRTSCHGSCLWRQRTSLWFSGMGGGGKCHGGRGRRQQRDLRGWRVVARIDAVLVPGSTVREYMQVEESERRRVRDGILLAADTECRVQQQQLCLSIGQKMQLLIISMRRTTRTKAWQKKEGMHCVSSFRRTVRRCIRRSSGTRTSVPGSEGSE